MDIWLVRYAVPNLVKSDVSQADLDLDLDTLQPCKFTVLINVASYTA